MTIRSYVVQAALLVSLIAWQYAAVADTEASVSVTLRIVGPSITIDDVFVNEGETAAFTVRLSNSSTETITVSYATTEGTAFAGEDYTAASGTITFLPGQISHTLNVATLEDSLDEANETFYVNLGNVTGPARLTDSQGLGTILNDDGIPSIVIDDVLVYEGETATFTVRLSNSSTETITVSYTTTEGTALAGEDYAVTSGIVTFLPGQMSHTLNVMTLDDLLDEVNETFLVNLGNVTGLANLADSQGMGTILDNDPAIPREGSPGGGAVVEGTACMPLFPLMLPSLRGYRRATLVGGDEDGDGRVGLGDTVRYHVTVWNEGSSLVLNVYYLDVLDPHGHLVAGSLTCSRGEVQAGGLLGLESVSVSLTLMALEPGAVVEIYYDVRVAAALPEGVWALVGQGILTADGASTVLTDDPTTAALMDATVVPLAGAGKTEPRPLSVEKRATVLDPAGQSNFRIAGKIVEYAVTVRNESNGVLTGVRLYEVIDPHVQLQTPSVRAEGIVQWSSGFPGALTMLLPPLFPGEATTLTYRVQVRSDLPEGVGFVGTRAIAVADDHVPCLSDDPMTPLVGDPTVILFPYWTSEYPDWLGWLERLSSASTGLLPIVLNQHGGKGTLRWVLYGADFYGDLSADPAIRPKSYPHLALVGGIEMPWDKVANGAICLRLAASESPGVESFLAAEPLFIQSEYNMPVISRIPETRTGDLLLLLCPNLELPICQGGLIPLFVDLDTATDWQVERLDDIVIYATFYEDAATEGR